jgi:hypothetical protein
MKKLLLLFLVITTSVNATVDLPSKRTTIDRVRAIIYHAEGPLLICDSDLRSDLSGNVPTLKDVVLKKLIALDGKKLKIPVSDTEIDRYLSHVQEELSLSRDGLIQFFKERGYSFEAAKKELEENLLVENTIEARVKSKAFVPTSEIEKYHKEHPVILYELKQGFVPFSGGSKALSRAIIDRDIDSGAIFTSISWNDAGIVKEQDFSSDKTYIKDLAVGSVAKIADTDEGISLLHIVSKKEVPLEERKIEIQQLLGRPRFMHALDDYYKKRLSEAHVRTFTKEDAASLAI